MVFLSRPQLSAGRSLIVTKRSCSLTDSKEVSSKMMVWSVKTIVQSKGSFQRGVLSSKNKLTSVYSQGSRSLHGRCQGKLSLMWLTDPTRLFSNSGDCCSSSTPTVTLFSIDYKKGRSRIGATYPIRCMSTDMVEMIKSKNTENPVMVLFQDVYTAFPTAFFSCFS